MESSPLNVRRPAQRRSGSFGKSSVVLALGLWLEEDARVAEAVTLFVARRAAELCKQAPGTATSHPPHPHPVSVVDLQVGLQN